MKTDAVYVPSMFLIAETEMTIDLTALDMIPRSFLTTYKDMLRKGDLDLPLLPEVASQILQMAAADSGNATAFSDLIHRDQALAGQVLRVANSSTFARRGNIVSLKQAVTRLGLDLLSDIAMTSILGTSVFQVSTFKPMVRYTWRHALAAGTFSKEIARNIRRNVESSFLCGLLHSIGKPLALNAIQNLEQTAGVNLDRHATIALVESTHQQAGEQVALKWRLPPAIRVAIGHYKDYSSATEFRNEATITYLACRFADLLLNPEAHDEAEIREDPVHAELNLYPDDVSKLLDMRERILVVVDSLDAGAV